MDTNLVGHDKRCIDEAKNIGRLSTQQILNGYIVTLQAGIMFLTLW